MDSKAIIIRATFDLIKKKSIDRVTVNDILQASSVSRSTFYRYFKDKYDVMNWCYKSYVDQLIDEFDGHNWNLKLQQTFEFLNTNGAYFDRISRLEGPNSFWAFIHSYTFDFYGSVYMENTEKAHLDCDDKIMLEYVCGGAISILKYWIQGGRKESPAVIARLLYRNLPKLAREFL